MATREALSQAATRLCAEHGLDNVTVEQIADAVDVSVRTFFNYFSSKVDALLAGDLASARAFVVEFARRPPGEDVVAALRSAALEVIEDETGFRERLRQMRTVREHPAVLVHQLASFVEQERELANRIAFRTGTNGAGLYPMMIAGSAMTALRIAIGRWLDHVDHSDGAEPAASLSALLNAAFDQLEAGLGRPPAPPETSPPRSASATGRTPESHGHVASEESQATGREWTP